MAKKTTKASKALPARPANNKLSNNKPANRKP